MQEEEVNCFVRMILIGIAKRIIAILVIIMMEAILISFIIQFKEAVSWPTCQVIV